MSQYTSFEFPCDKPIMMTASEVALNLTPQLLAEQEAVDAKHSCSSLASLCTLSSDLGGCESPVSPSMKRACRMQQSAAQRLHVHTCSELQPPPLTPSPSRPKDFLCCQSGISTGLICAQRKAWQRCRPEVEESDGKRKAATSLVIRHVFRTCAGLGLCGRCSCPLQHSVEFKLHRPTYCVTVFSRVDGIGLDC